MSTNRLLFALLLVLVLSPWGLLIYSSLDSKTHLDAIENRLLEARQAESTLRAAIETSESQRTGLETDLSNFRSIISSMERQEEALIAEVASLRESLAARDEAAAGDRQSFRNRIEAATEETMTALRRVDDISRAYNQLERDALALETRLTQIEGRNEQLETENSRLSTIIRRLGLNPDSTTAVSGNRVQATAAATPTPLPPAPAPAPVETSRPEAQPTPPPSAEPSQSESEEAPRWRIFE
jgi:outer membrane murein-binding lipoprotein Lpp